MQDIVNYLHRVRCEFYLLIFEDEKFYITIYYQI